MELSLKIQVVNRADGKHKGKWQWLIAANNGKLLGAASQAHETRSACLREIKAIQAALPAIPIVEGTAPDAARKVPQAAPKGMSRS